MASGQPHGHTLTLIISQRSEYGDWRVGGVVWSLVTSEGELISTSMTLCKQKKCLAKDTYVIMQIL